MDSYCWLDTGKLSGNNQSQISPEQLHCMQAVLPFDATWYKGISLLETGTLTLTLRRIRVSNNFPLVIGRKKWTGDRPFKSVAFTEQPRAGNVWITTTNSCAPCCRHSQASIRWVFPDLPLAWTLPPLLTTTEQNFHFATTATGGKCILVDVKGGTFLCHVRNLIDHERDEFLQLLFTHLT